MAIATIFELHADASFIEAVRLILDELHTDPAGAEIHAVTKIGEIQFDMDLAPEDVAMVTDKILKRFQKDYTSLSVRVRKVNSFTITKPYDAALAARPGDETEDDDAT